MPAYHMPVEEPEWPAEAPEPECTCDLLPWPRTPGVSEWCPACQREFNAWSELEAAAATQDERTAA